MKFPKLNPTSVSLKSNDSDLNFIFIDNFVISRIFPLAGNFCGTIFVIH